MIKKLVSNIKQRIKRNNFSVFQWIIYLSLLSLLIYILLIPFIHQISKWIYLLYFFIYLGFALYGRLVNVRFLRDSAGNGIIYGGRGKGKGLLMQKKANALRTYYSNVPMGHNHLDFNLKEYVDSVGDNTIEDAINGTITITEKMDKYEGINILFDDVTVYAPNFVDSLLKKTYERMPITLAVNRHLYNHYMIISVQDRDRPYKILRELQTDYSIKAISSSGWGYIWRCIPILRNFVTVKYRYYEEVKASQEGVLPFAAAGAINEGVKHGYLTSGQATKEEFEAKYGKVYHGRIWMRKNQLYYDTRYFHQLFFGKPAPN